MGSRGCQIPGDFLLVSQRDWLQITESLSFHLWERKKKKKLTASKWKKLNTTNAERGQVVFVFFFWKDFQKILSSQKFTKKKWVHGRKEIFRIRFSPSFYCMTYLTQMTRYSRKVKLVTSEVMTQFSHSFIYFEVAHTQIFPGLKSSSFPEATKSWNMQFGHTRRAPKYPNFSIFSHHLCILGFCCLEEGKEEG